MNRSIIITGALALSALAALFACSARVNVGSNMPFFGGTEVAVDIDPRSEPPTVAVESTDEGGTLAPGTCVRFTWLDAAGNPVGSTDVEAGGDPAPIPEGAESATAGPCDPPEEEEPKPRKRRANIDRFVASELPLEVFPFRFFPLDFAQGVPVRYVDYGVKAWSLEEARCISESFVRTLFSASPPAQVETRSASEVTLLADGRVRVTMFSVEAPESLVFRWNGQTLFDLDDALVVAMDGWYATTVHVPEKLVDASSTMLTANSFHYDLVADGLDVGGLVEVSIDPF